MKNNPLGFLTGYSHERLNVLHRWSGRATVVYACLHVMYIPSFPLTPGSWVLTRGQSVHDHVVSEQEL